jgi:hypothetical protein
MTARCAVYAHMVAERSYDEQRLAQLIGALPPAPEAWVRAAEELPRTRRELEEIVARTQTDEEFRRQVTADLEAALQRAGYEPDPDLVAQLRARLAASSEPPGAP